MVKKLISLGGEENGWVEPTAVVAIRTNHSYPGGTEVILADGSRVRAAGTTDEVAKLINDALKGE